MSSRRALYRILGVGLRGRKCSISATLDTRRTLEVSLEGCSLVLLSVVVKRVDKVHLTEVLGTSIDASSVPVVFYATHSSRSSVIGNLGLNTSSCVAGPCSMEGIVTEIGAILEEASKRGMTRHGGSLSISKLSLSLSLGAYRISNRRIGLAGGRFRLLTFLVTGGNGVYSESRVLTGI